MLMDCSCLRLQSGLAFLLASCLTLCLIDHSCGSDDEERLVKDLFARYNRLIRPVRHMNETVKVEFTLILSLLINVQEKEQVMKTNVWLQFKWIDPQMTWEPANYGGIQSIRLPVDKIWTPDVVLINNADGKYTESFKSNIVVQSTGDLLWLPPSIYKSTCDIKVQNFPFDEQICDMKFQSWTYNADEVMLEFPAGMANEIEMSNYQPSGTWDVVKAPGFRNVYRKSPAEARQADITYKIIIRRKTLFYTINLLIPTVLVSFLSVLVFYLPTIAGEKVALSISILLTLNVFLLLVSKLLPPASDLPLIGKFLLFTFLMNLVSIIITVVTINLNFRSPKTHTMPSWIKKVFLDCLPVVLLMRRPKKPKRHNPYAAQQSRLAANHRPTTTAFNPSSAAPLSDGYREAHEMVEFRANDARNRAMPVPSSTTTSANLGHSRAFGRQVYSDTPPPEASFQPSQRYNGQPPLDECEEWLLKSPDVRLVTNSIECIVQYHQQNDAIQEVEDDWKYVALVVDRLLLWIFFIATTAGSFKILLSADTIFESLEEAKNRKYF
ncbi:hypothetical protein RvY_06355 [Ramazzottius varieornatus]|uniref:Uncharacterized protein n=1 Tax=Ramazzottius varieornatus TaxID=947166 RepID=A0A1D1V4N5_RAMVA|nr:hypothetical protein RvY_06355 [Ramazzottius varieornatus]